jgi:two-component system catabolic regulation response regulator CreB
MNVIVPGEILLVEDEQSIADSVIYALQTEGFRVTHCLTAGDARVAMGAIPPNLILLDVGLPDESGFEFCRRVRSVSQVPVLFLTARAGEVDRVAGLEIGADDYIVKPFSPRELAARVRAVLRRVPPSASSPAASDDSPAPGTASRGASRNFTVDHEKMKISYRGERLDLTRYEYRILEILIGSPGRVFSREQLMERAWEDPGSAMDRTVDTHMKSLRSKLRLVAPDHEPLVTHRGFGYSLAEEE